MSVKQASIAAASGAALLAAAPVNALPVLSDVSTSVKQSDGPCVLETVVSVASKTTPLQIAPAQASICKKERHERGYFFCKGFWLYRW